MRDIPIGVRELPTREGVRAEPRVEHRQARDEAAITEVGEVLPQLEGSEHSLVDQRPAGKAREVEELGVLDASATDGLFEALSNHVELPFEGVITQHAIMATDEQVLHVR